MTLRVYVSRDAAALALGADETALALQKAVQAKGHSIELIRIGSRGMVWLEPLVEVEVAGERIGYGPVNAAAVPALIEAGLLHGAPHALRLGAVRELPYLARQERLTFAPRRHYRSAGYRSVHPARGLFRA